MGILSFGYHASRDHFFFQNSQCDVDAGDEAGITKKDAAQWFLYYVGHKYKDQFVIAAQGLSMPCHTSKFDAKESQALFKNCNLGPKSQKLLRKHIREKLGAQVFASKNKIHKLGDGAVPPDTSTLIVDHKVAYSFRRECS